VSFDLRFVMSLMTHGVRYVNMTHVEGREVEFDDEVYVDDDLRKKIIVW
jgi:hypothetical protein